MTNNVQESQPKNLAGGARNIQIVVFRLGAEEYALTIEQIKEVVRTPAITKMPHSATYIKGVANIRGNIIAIIDLEERFGVIPSAEQEKKDGLYTLVIESEEFKMGVLVKEVPNTLAINEGMIDQSALIADGVNSYIKGIVKMEGRLIILIDIFKVVNMKDLARNEKTIAA